MDASGVLTRRDERKRIKWSQNSSRQGQEQAGTMHMRQRGSEGERDGLMMESKSIVAVISVVVVVVGSGGLGRASSAGSAADPWVSE